MVTCRRIRFRQSLTNSVEHNVWSRQLGENMPIAMEAGAKSMGLSIGDFIKQVETGSVLAKDFMLPFARELRRTVRENGALAAAQEKLTAQQQRMNTEFKVLIDEIFQGGFSKTIGGVFKLIADGVKAAAPRIKELFLALGSGVDLIVDLGRNLGTTLTGGLNKAKNEAGALLRTWWGLLSAWYAALAVIELLNIGLAKLNEWSPTIEKLDWFASKKDYADVIKGNAILNGTGVSGKTTTVNVGQVNLNTTSNDPERHSLDFANQIGHMLGGY